ncbi:MAG: hypothetical protein JWL70_1115 [Acidimicrobiia bacterium]|nr:hypothetical protein [Acidimicrobiia bacterium]
MHTDAIHGNPVGHAAAEHPAVVKVGRAGWFAKGVVYVLAGGLALTVVAESFGWSASQNMPQEASPTGAIKEVAQSDAGPVLLVAFACGMFLYALWRAATAVLPGSTDVAGLATRVGYMVSAIVYTTFGITAVSLAKTRTANVNGNRTVNDMTTRIMEHSTGRWVIGLVGMIDIGAGLYRIVLGLKSDVTEDLDMSAMSTARAQWAPRLGAFGEVGRGVGIGLIGFFLVRAAIKFNPAEATGLDGALRRLALTWWGVALVALVGLGFVAYGVFCLVTFPRRRLQAP